MSDTRTAETLQSAREADMAAFSLGTVMESSHLHSSGFLSSQQFAELADEGAVGEICGQFFAIDGSRRGLELAARTISLSLDEIMRIPVRVMLASGVEKRDAVIGALAGNYMTDLFIDSELAASLLCRLGANPVSPDAGLEMMSPERGVRNASSEGGGVSASSVGCGSSG